MVLLPTLADGMRRLLEVRSAFLAAAGPRSGRFGDTDAAALAHLVDVLAPTSVLVDDPSLAALLARLPGLEQVRPLAGAPLEGALVLAEVTAPPAVPDSALLLLYGWRDRVSVDAIAGLRGRLLLPVAGRALGLWRAGLVAACLPGQEAATEQALSQLALMFNDAALDPLVLTERLQQMREAPAPHPASTAGFAALPGGGGLMRRVFRKLRRIYHRLRSV